MKLYYFKWPKCHFKFKGTWRNISLVIPRWPPTFSLFSSLSHQNLPYFFIIFVYFANSTRKHFPVKFDYVYPSLTHQWIQFRRKKASKGEIQRVVGEIFILTLQHALSFNSMKPINIGFWSDLGDEVFINFQ